MITAKLMVHDDSCFPSKQSMLFHNAYHLRAILEGKISVVIREHVGIVAGSATSSPKKGETADLVGSCGCDHDRSSTEALRVLAASPFRIAEIEQDEVSHTAASYPLSAQTGFALTACGRSSAHRRHRRQPPCRE
jgi:hypothetical protein